MGIALLALLLVLPASHARVCPPCGSTAVPYPLSTGDGCGDPAYKVRCAAATNSSTSSPTLMFDALNGTSYRITSISAATQRLVVAPAPLVAQGSRCVSEGRGGGVQLNASLPFNVSSSNTIMLLNCTSALLLSPLNCSSNSLCHVYANATGSTAAACAPLPLCCTFVAGGSSTSYSIRVSPQFCSAYRSFVGLDPAAQPPATWGRRLGLELQWATPREPLCRTQADCEDGANATCADDPLTPAARRCFCVPGLSWSPLAGACQLNPSDCQIAGGCGGSNHAPLIAGLVCGLGGALLLAAAGLLAYRRQRRVRLARERLAKEREEILNANNASGRTARNFSGRELKRATGNFSRDNLLGAGGYGEVYRGVLGDGTVVAVKCAKLGNTKSTDQVLNEVRVLSQVNHRSLVRLLGCCVDLDQPLMVYEFVPNGTLADHLHGATSLSRPPTLGWRQRLAIARQTAEGVAYLHSAAVPPIYHRDIKSSNILLDARLDAKVSDFGLSRLAEPGLSHVSTCAQGTLGYLDPEYYRNYQLTDKSDVYSFGVVLLELLTSKRAIDFARGADDVNLAVHVQRAADEERLMDVVDPAIKDGATQLQLDTMKALGFLALGCLEERRQNRPSMKEVAEEIEYIINIEAAGHPIEQQRTCLDSSE
ncbi:putative WAK-related receptor-like protein kinase family protein precursor [Zea mays]|uniref:Wall-associated receptor kinase-like 20 n=2 Tax=Zea mays TaxID=4577 RepID=C0P4E2_MAIZE|nr:putative WAK-related receptor-like protein kinase family protein precursor [Zea mays]ACN27858.1 unknown [Zea mays]AQK52046.1 Wall-associated receptor kinase-like 20 [Zea mays]|eukprot:NP_001168336.1 putative WAK-related receptor-like protein kinase family protein precursor [Zea mays]